MKGKDLDGMGEEGRDGVHRGRPLLPPSGRKCVIDVARMDVFVQCVETTRMEPREEDADAFTNGQGP